MILEVRGTPANIMLGVAIVGRGSVPFFMLLPKLFLDSKCKDLLSDKACLLSDVKY